MTGPAVTRRPTPMTLDDRVAAIKAFRFTERQARFLVTVMLHSGVCLGRQYCAFAGIVHGAPVANLPRDAPSASVRDATDLWPQPRTSVPPPLQAALRRRLASPTIGFDGP